MAKSHYAGIDIGSNAVRLLVKCLNEPGSTEPLSKVQLVRVPRRLGEDAFVDGRISKKKSKQPKKAFLLAFLEENKEAVWVTH